MSINRKYNSLYAINIDFQILFFHVSFFLFPIPTASTLLLERLRLPKSLPSNTCFPIQPSTDVQVLHCFYYLYHETLFLKPDISVSRSLTCCFKKPFIRATLTISLSTSPFQLAPTAYSQGDILQATGHVHLTLKFSFKLNHIPRVPCFPLLVHHPKEFLKFYMFYEAVAV